VFIFLNAHVLTNVVDFDSERLSWSKKFKI
jgi:hypothetical protein